MTTRIFCLRCDHFNEELARYCSRCGAELPLTDRTIELRQGTAVFCDLVGSGLLPQRVDAEALADFYARYWRFVAEIARRNSGMLNRKEGDGCLLLFGYPSGSEDAAECAVRTCIELNLGIASGVELAGHTSQLRVGAASGTIIVEPHAADPSTNKELKLLGVVVDRAKRLTELALPGTALIDDDTRRLAGHFFAYRDFGAHLLKHVDQPVHVWEAVAETSVVSRFDARRQTEVRDAVGALVGREEELATIRNCWRSAQVEGGRVVWISGEPGIGKSSLARWFAANELPHDAVRLDMQCMARSERSPLFPVGALLRSRAGIEITDSEEQRASKARALFDGLLPASRSEEAVGLASGLLGLPIPLQLALIDADALRERTIVLLCEIFAAFARSHPTLLSCEDLHWADATTESLLARVADGSAQLPMLLVITSRQTPPVAAPGVVSFARCTGLELQPLDDTHASMIVRRVASDLPLSDEQIAALVARAEGLPLIIEELAHNVRHQADINGLPDASAGNHRKRDVPGILKAIIQGRMDRSPSVIPIVHAASVLGREFSLPLMMGLTADVADVPLALDEVVQLGLLKQQVTAGVATLRFKHGLIQEAVYDSMLASNQKKLHSRVADLLRDGMASADECTPDARAHHLLSAERHAEGVHCLYEAGFAMASRAAYVESLAYAEQGLKEVEHVPVPEQRLQLKMLLLCVKGLALSAVQGYAAPDVEEAYREARNICSEGGNPVVLFPIARGLATFYFVRAQMATAGALAVQCVELAAEAKVPAFEVEALTFLGYTDSYLGRPKAGRLALENAIHLGKTLQGPFPYTSTQHPMTAAMALLANAAWAQGDAETAEAVVKDGLAFVEALQRPFDIAYMNAWAAGLRNLQRRWDEAQFHAQQCLVISEKYALRIWIATAMMQGGIAAVSKAPAADALAVLQGALQGFLLAGAETNTGYFRWGIARGQRQVGDDEGARKTVAQALEHVDRTDEGFIRGELLILAAELETDAPRTDSLLAAAIQEGIDVEAPTLALRAGLMLLRHRGMTSDDPRRDHAAQLALDGQSVQAPSADWIHEAWAGVREALLSKVQPGEMEMTYQRSPSSIERSIEH